MLKGEDLATPGRGMGNLAPRHPGGCFSCVAFKFNFQRAAMAHGGEEAAPDPLRAPRLPRSPAHAPAPCVCGVFLTLLPLHGGGCHYPLDPQCHPVFHCPRIFGALPPPHPTFGSKKKLKLLSCWLKP